MVHYLCPSHHSSKGKPACYGLGYGNYVRHHPEVLYGKELTRSAEPGLDLVCHKKDAVFFGYLPEFYHVFPGRHYETPFSYHRLNDHCSNLLGVHMGYEELLNVEGTLYVAVRVLTGKGAAITIGIGKPVNFRRKGAKALLIWNHLGGHGQGEQGSSVEGVLKDHNPWSGSVMPGNFNCIFHSLCSGIDQKTLFGEIPREKAHQFFHHLKIGLVHGSVETGAQELLRLGLYRLLNLGIGVPHIQGAYGPGKINVPFPVLSPYYRSLSRFNENRIGIVNPAGNKLIPFPEQLLLHHTSSEFITGHYGENPLTYSNHRLFPTGIYTYVTGIRGYGEVLPVFTEQIGVSKDVKPVH